VANPNLYQPQSGRKVLDDGSVVNTAKILVDSTDVSGSIKTVTEFQSAVHAGESFSYSANQIGLAIGGTVSILARTGSKQVHFDGFNVKVSQGPFRIVFYEAPTVTDAGTIVETERRNRNIATVSLTDVYLNPTVSDNGRILDDDLMPEISQGAVKNAGSGEIDTGWVLMPNTDYLVVLTNMSAAIVNWSARFTWHEAIYNT
jgi:hypothetical protein